MAKMLDDYREAVKNFERKKEEYNAFNKINTNSREELVLPKGQTFASLVVFSNLEIGNIEFERFRLNKLLAHINEVASMKDAYVVLGGNIFYCDNNILKKERGNQTSIFDDDEDEEKYCAVWQASVAREIFEPIKDKIVGVYDGDYEKKYLAKSALNPSLMLCKYLGIPNLYHSEGMELDIVFNSEWTNGTDQVIKCYLGYGFLSSNTFNTTYNKTEGMRTKIGGKDVYISSKYNMFMHAVESNITAEDKEHTMKQNQHIISVAGYKDFYVKRLKERNSKPAYTDNKLLRLFVTPNQDVTNIRGNHNIIEPEYKICCDDIDFGRNNLEDFNFDLMTQVNMINRTNTAVAEFIKSYIDNKTEILTKTSTAKLISNTYVGKYHVKTKLPKKKVSKKEPKTKRGVPGQLYMFEGEEKEDGGREL